jgi:hypothetical protein
MQSASFWKDRLMQPKSLYLSDLLTGLLAGLALRKITALSIRSNQFDQALARLVDQDVRPEAERLGFVVKFRVRPHEIHGDSTAVQRALYEAAQRDLISLDNPEFQDIRLKIGPAEAPSYFEGLPGSQEMYEAFSSKLMQYYHEAAP